MAITVRFRIWLLQKLYGFLEPLTHGFILLERNPDKQFSLRKCSLERDPEFFWGLLPILRVRVGKTLSLDDVITVPVEESRKALLEELSQTPQAVLEHADGFLKNSAKQRVGRTKAKVLDEVEKLFHSPGGKQLLDYVKKDRNAFRQALLEQLANTAAETFSKITRQHMAELILRTREEYASDAGAQQLDSSQPEAVAFPTGTRFFVRKGKLTAFVIEQSPMKRTLQIMDSAGDRAERYELSFPYVIFFVTFRNTQFDNLYIFFNKEPLREVGDALLCPALSNIGEDFHVCFGGPSREGTFAETAEAALNNFWGGRFKLTDWSSFLTSQIKLGEWEAQTKRNTLFGLQFNWRPANQTIGSMLTKIGKDFVVEEKKQKAVAGASLSAMEKCVERLAVSLTQQIKEALFYLVPKWDLDEQPLQQITDEFKKSVEELILLSRTELDGDIEGVLSEKNIKRALIKAVERATQVMADSDQSIYAARQALQDLVKEGQDDDTGPFEETR